jgi:hypothetical protein
MENKDLFEVLSNCCWSLICVGCDDESYMWVVVGDYMAKPHKRVLGFTYEEDKPELAIVDALKTTKDDHYNYLCEYHPK